MTRKIAIVTTSRADYSYYLPILRQIEQEPTLQYQLIVAGMHLAPQFGSTIQAIQADGFEIAEQVDLLVAGDNPTAIAKSMGLGLIGFSQAYAQLKPDILLLLGDRFEMFAAGAAMVPFNTPIAHIAGGEVTEGAIDDAFRHALSKMSHLHFVSTERYKQRLIQMGEEPWRITVSGATSLDNLRHLPLLSREDLSEAIQIPLDPAPLLVTFHPVTLEGSQTQEHISELLQALDSINLPIIFTLPNADTHNTVIAQAIHHFVQTHPHCYFVSNLGTIRYFSLLRYAIAMVGNSSSGIIEAASFKLPVVNIGQRQKGRIYGRNVLTVPCTHEAILRAIHQAISPEFRHSLSDLQNIYGEGQAATAIISVLRSTPLNAQLLQKQFYDLS